MEQQTIKGTESLVTLSLMGITDIFISQVFFNVLVTAVQKN